jgi:hypothetical protein
MSKARSLANRANDIVSVLDFGAVGDGVADDTAAIQAAVNAALTVVFTQGSNYKLLSPVTLRNGQMLIGNGATVTQGTANTEIFNIEAKSNIEVYGFNFVGIGTDYSESDSNRGVALYGGTSGSNIRIHDNKFTNFGYTSVRFAGQDNCAFTDNIVTGPGSPILTPITSGRCYGVLFDSGCDGVLVQGNSISQTAQGIRVEGNLTGTSNIRISDNRIYDIIGQHGVYAGAYLSYLTIAENTINDTDLCGIKVQAADYATINNRGISITGNTVGATGDQGILVCSGDNPTATYKCENVTIAGNAIRFTTGNGIKIDNVINGVIDGNSIISSTKSGIAWEQSTGLIISDNFIQSSGNTALRDVTAASFVNIKDNVIRNCATANTGSDEYGILVGAAGSEYVIDKNVITDANANMQYGIFISASINSTLTLTDNIVTSATDTGLRLGSTAALREYRGNNWNGTLVSTYNDPVLVVVASASTISLPTAHDVVSISGTTNISTINTNGHSGRIVTLFFQGALTVVRGSTIILNSTSGNFVTTANDTLTLVCDGSYWYEVSRSTN